MNCPKCNQPVEPDSQFCRHCGAALPSAAPPTSAPLLAAVPDSAQSPNPYRDPAFEKPVWQGRPAWRASYGVWFLWAVLSIAALYVAHRYEASQTTGNIIWLLIAAAAVVIFSRQAVTSWGTEYRLTTQRLFVHRGILSRITDQMELVRVDDVRVRQGVIDRLVNTGDIEIIGSDKTDENFRLHAVSDPADVAESLRRNVRAARGKGALFVENV